MTMKPYLATLAATILAGSMVLSPASAEGSTGTMFRDLNGHWAQPTIESLAKLGVVRGSDGQVRPNDPISRAEFVRLLLTATDLPIDKTANMPFADVPASHWAFGDIATAYAKGLVNGVDAQHFTPDAPITREQLAKLLTVNSKSLARETSTVPTFSDVNGGWSYSYIVDAYQIGLIKGLGGNRFAPTDNASRAEAFVMIERMLRKETKSANLPTDEMLLGRVNAVVQSMQQASGELPAGISDQFAAGVPTSGLPKQGYVLQSSHVMERAEHLAKVKVISASNADASGSKTYEFLEAILIKRDGQWKIGYFVPVGQ